MDSPEKLATRRAGEKNKKQTNKQTKTQYVMDTTKRKQTLIT